MSDKKKKLHDPFHLHIPNFILNTAPGIQKSKFTGFQIPHRNVINASANVYEPKLLLGKKDEKRISAAKLVKDSSQSKSNELNISKTINNLTQEDKRKMKQYKDLELLANNLKENNINYQLNYLNYSLPKNSEHFTSFNLIAKPYEQLDKYNYYTITHEGVTYWSGSENYFVSLDEWQEQYKMFFKIIQIKTFLRFRLWKGFIVWLKTIKWSKFYAAQSVLENQLLIANVQLGEAILRLQKRIYEYHSFCLIDTADEACTSAITTEGFYPIDEILVYPSVAKMREAMSYMDRAKKRTFCKFISTFLTYCDYLILNMLHQIMGQGYSGLLNIAETHSYNAQPSGEILSKMQILMKKPSDFKSFFFVELVLKPDVIEINPSEDVATYVLKRLTTLWLDAMKDFDNFTDDQFFLQFTKPSIMGRQEDKQTGVPPSLLFLLKTDAEYKANENKIFDMLAKTYKDINTFIMMYDDIHIDYKTDVFTKPLVLHAALNNDTFQNYASHYNKNIDFGDKINNYENIGIIKLLQQIEFKEIITPVYKELLSALEIFLIKLAMQKIETINSKSEEIINNILSLTEDEKKNKTSSINETIDNLMLEVDVVHDMFIIMKEFQMVVDDNKKESYMDCEDMVNSCRDLLIENISFPNEHIEVENQEGDNNESENQEGDNNEDGNQEGDNNEGGNQEGNNEGENQEGDNNKGENQEGDNNEGENQEGDNNEGGIQEVDNNEGENQEGDNNEGGNQEGDNNEGGNQEGDNEGENQEGDNNEGEIQEGDNNEGGNLGGDNNEDENQEEENNEGEIQEGDNNEGENQEGDNNEGENQEVGNNEGGNQEGDNNEGEIEEGDNNEGGNQEGDNNEGENLEEGNNEGEIQEVGNTEGGNLEGGNNEGENQEVGNNEGENQQVGNNEGGNQEGDNNEGEIQEGDNNEGGNQEGDNNEGEIQEGDNNEGGNQEGDNNEGEIQEEDNNEGGNQEGDNNEGEIEEGDNNEGGNQEGDNNEGENLEGGNNEGEIQEEGNNESEIEEGDNNEGGNQERDNNEG